MSETSTATTTSVGVGIPMPLLTYRWRASFYFQSNKLPFSDALRNQVIRFSPITQWIDGPAGDRTSTFSFEVQENVHNDVAPAIQQLAKLDRFTVRIEYLDGNDGVIKTMDLRECAVQRIEHSAVDYAGGASRTTRLGVHCPTLEGLHIETLRAEPVADALLTILKGTSIELYEDLGGGTITQTVTVVFKSEVEIS